MRVSRFAEASPHNPDGSRNDNIRNDAYGCLSFSPILNNSMHGQHFCHAVSRRANNTTSENTVFVQARYSIYTMLCFKESFIQSSQQQGVEVGIREAVPVKT